MCSIESVEENGLHVEILGIDEENFGKRKGEAEDQDYNIFTDNEGYGMWQF